MVAITCPRILALALDAVVAVSAAAVPAEKRQTICPDNFPCTPDYCVVQFTFSHTFGGGGPGQQNINNFGWGFTAGPFDGDKYGRTLDGNTHWEFGVAAADYHAEVDIYVYANYDPTNESFTDCVVSVSGGPYHTGKITNNTDTNYISTFTSVCEMDFPCINVADYRKR